SHPLLRCRDGMVRCAGNRRAAHGCRTGRPSFATAASVRNAAPVLTDRSGRRDIARTLPTHARGQPEALPHVAGIERLPQNVALSDTLTVRGGSDDRGPSFEPVPAERVVGAT